MGPVRNVNTVNTVLTKKYQYSKKEYSRTSTVRNVSTVRTSSIKNNSVRNISVRSISAVGTSSGGKYQYSKNVLSSVRATNTFRTISKKCISVQ